MTSSDIILHQTSYYYIRHHIIDKHTVIVLNNNDFKGTPKIPYIYALFDRATNI